jgi:uncharacterized phage protein gp47/JayE
MPATPSFKTLPAILQEAIDYIVANSPLTDVIPGSVIRTIVEAESIQDADQYVQLALVMTAFNLSSATGDDLDKRVLDFGFTRLPAAQATGSIVVTDTSISAVYDATLNGAIITGAGTLIVNESIAAWPASGVLILDQDILGAEEYVPYTSKNNGTKTFTLGGGGPLFGHQNGASVILSQQGADQTIPLGTVVFVPATAISPQINFQTTAVGFVEDGAQASLPIPVIAQQVGAAGNVAANAINTFVSLPFVTAVVTNPLRAFGGADRETDSALVQRVKAHIQALSDATDVALVTAAIGVTDGTEEVTTAQAVDSIITPGLVTLYIDNGQGLVASTANIQDEMVVLDGLAGQTRGRLAFFPGVIGSLRLYVSQFNSVSTSTGVGTITDTTQAWTVNQWANFIVTDASGVFYTILSNTATTLTLNTPLTPAAGKYAIIARRTDAPLVVTTDYVINWTVNEFQLTVALTADQRVVAMAGTVTPGYSYYSGLIRAVQRVISGDPTDLTDFPGVAAAGIQVTVSPPTIINQTFDLSVQTIPGVALSSLSTAVQQAVLNYVNKLNIGDDVIIAEIIAVVMGITGVFDVQVITPPSNVIVGDGQIARTSLATIFVT